MFTTSFCGTCSSFCLVPTGGREPYGYKGFFLCAFWMFAAYQSLHLATRHPEASYVNYHECRSVSAKLRDRLRCIIGSLQTAWMGGPEEQRSRPFALASGACNGEGIVCAAQGGTFRRIVHPCAQYSTPENTLNRAASPINSVIAVDASRKSLPANCFCSIQKMKRHTCWDRSQDISPQSNQRKTASRCGNM